MVQTNQVGNKAVGSDWISAGAALIDAGADVANTVYQIDQNDKNQKYQKALQELIFTREDNAVQRRMADLELAGLNPNLAAGSSANAGQVVGRSDTQKLDFGSALDAISHIQQIRAQRQATQNAQVEHQILQNNVKESQAKMDMADSQRILLNAELLNQLGIPYKIKVGVSGNQYGIRIGFDNEGKGDGLYEFASENAPLKQIYDYNTDNARVLNALLNKDEDWYTADKVSGIILGALNSGAHIKNAYR